MNKFLSNQRRTNEKLNSDTVDEKNRKLLHGKEIWNILHTYSVYLESNASNKDIQSYKDFIYGILYFGTKNDNVWIENFNRFDKILPFQNIKNRDEAMLWNCKFHNYVNIKLERDIFECNSDNISKRWGNYKKIIEEKNNVL